MSPGGAPALLQSSPSPYLFLLCSWWISFVCTSSCFSSLVVDREFSSSCISMRDVWFSTCTGTLGVWAHTAEPLRVPIVPRNVATRKQHPLRAAPRVVQQRNCPALQFWWQWGRGDTRAIAAHLRLHVGELAALLSAAVQQGAADLQHGGRVVLHRRLPQPRHLRLHAALDGALQLRTAARMGWDGSAKELTPCPASLLPPRHPDVGALRCSTTHPECFGAHWEDGTCCLWLQCCGGAPGIAANILHPASSHCSTPTCLGQENGSCCLPALQLTLLKSSEVTQWEQPGTASLGVWMAHCCGWHWSGCKVGVRHSGKAELNGVGGIYSHGDAHSPRMGLFSCWDLAQVCVFMGLLLSWDY